MIFGEVKSVSADRSLGREIVDLSTEVIPRFLGRICSFHNSGYHRDIGTLESLRRAEAEYRWPD